MLQMTAELVPNFSGCDSTYPVTRWIEDVESNGEIFNWTPLQQLLVARRSLSGTAQLWLRAERPFKSWDDLKAAILKEFPDSVDVKTIHEMMSARKKRADETCLDYMLIMKELGKRGKMADYVAIKYIVDGIMDIETNKIMLYGVTSYSELKEKLKIYETILSKMQSSRQRHSTGASVSTTSKHHTKTNMNTSGASGASGWRVRCYGCGELGHTSADCPHKNKGLKCFKCNEFGHVGSRCTNSATERNRKSTSQHHRVSSDDVVGKAGGSHDRYAKSAMFAADVTQDSSATSDELTNQFKMADHSSQSTSKTEMTSYGTSGDTMVYSLNDERERRKMAAFVYDRVEQLSTSMSNEKKPVVIANVNNVRVKALVDSGSDVNLISEEVFKAIGMPKCEKDELSLCGIGLSTVRSMGKCRVRLCIDEQCYEDVIFHVLSKNFIPFRMILGQEFLNDVTVVLKGGCVRLYSKDWERLGCYASEVCSLGSVVGQMVNPALKNEVIQCVQNYKPKQVKETPLQLRIVLSDEAPVAMRPRRLSLKEQEVVDDQVSDWLEKGIIRVSYSEYSSPLVLVKKKDGSTRVCVDYRMLNKKIIKDEFPLPVIEDLIDKLKDAKVYSVLDLKNGFFHLKISEESIKYTSFVTHNGQFEFLRAPFGLSICPKYFMRFISIIFRDLLVKGEIIIFIDDLLIPAENEIQAVQRLKNVLMISEQYGLEINWKKAKLISREIEYLGHLIRNGEVRPTAEKTDAVMRYPKPTSVRQVRSFLGLTSYFRKYIKDYAVIAKPLSDLLRKDVVFAFGDKECMAFNSLKRKLSNSPVLKIYDSNLPTELHTDAASVAHSAILLQLHPDGWHPVYYMSKKNSDAESKYCSYELEALAIIEGVKRFRVYLYGIHFTIVTDCQAFEMTLRKKDLCPKVARWVLYLDQFDYEVVHRAGAKMQHADALSRNPCMTIVTNSLQDQIRSAQQKDDGLRAICEILQNGSYSDYWLDNRLLYKGEQKLLVIPKCLDKEIIKQVHSKGHFSMKKMKEIISKDYFIPDIEKKLQDFVVTCIPCLLATRKAGKQEGYLSPIEKEGTPLHTIHIDHLGPLTDTKKQYNHILTVVDAFTKFTWIFPTKSTTSKETIEKLKIHQQNFGNPVRIISDRGTAFTSGEFQEYCQEENIQHITITTGVPRGNGQVERLHRTILAILTKLCIESPSLWYRHVSSVQRALNSTYQRSINTTPFHLMIGTAMRTKEDLHILELLKQEEINQFEENREEIRIHAKQQILKVQEENKKTFDKNRKESFKYEEGDLVAIKRTQFGPGLKLKPKYLGPYRVVKVKRKDRYDVEKLGSAIEGPNRTSSSADLMKPWPQQGEE